MKRILCVEDNDDNQYQYPGLEQGVIDLRNRLPNKRRGVEGNFIGQAGGKTG